MKENIFEKSLNFDPDQKIVKCSKLVREAPRAIQKIKKKMSQKGPGPNFGPRALLGHWALWGPCGPLKSCNIVSAYGREGGRKGLGGGMPP